LILEDWKMRSEKRRKASLGVATLAGAALVMSGGTAKAALLVYDGFAESSDTVGANLGGTNPALSPGQSPTPSSWVAQTGVTDNSFVSQNLSFPASYTNAPAVAGGSAVSINGNDDSPNGNVDRVVLSSSFGSGNGLSTGYYSLLMDVTDLTNIEANGVGQPSNNYALVASFSDSNGLTGGLGTQTSGLYVRAGADSGTFDVGIGANRNGVVWSTSDYAVGTTLFLAADFISGAPDTSSLWINPQLGLSSAPSPDFTSNSGEAGGFGDNLVDVFDLASNPGDPTGGNGVVVDEVRVGTTFADVTPAGAALPEPGGLGLVTLGAGLLLRGRRARKA
jgi:hypothetical protein